MMKDPPLRVNVDRLTIFGRGCGSFHTSTKIPLVAAPRITLRCDCGAEEMVSYGERWTCAKCGRTYDTSQIPDGDYQAIQSLRRRYRIVGYACVALVAAFVLLLALTAQEFQLFIGLPFILLLWFTYVRPFMHRRYRRQVGELTRTWTLHAEGER